MRGRVFLGPSASNWAPTMPATRPMLSASGIRSSSSLRAQGFQVYSNVVYVAAGMLGMGFGSAGHFAGSQPTRVAARVTMLMVAIMLVATGLVSTWYHRVGTDENCCRSTYLRVGKVDIGCAVTTLVAGIGVLVPLTIVGLTRKVRVGPIVLLALTAATGITAASIHARLTLNKTRQRNPAEYDVLHGAWHALGGVSAGCAFTGAWLALRP
jgi:hypothetical protein